MRWELTEDFSIKILTRLENWFLWQRNRICTTRMVIYVMSFQWSLLKIERKKSEKLKQNVGFRLKAQTNVFTIFFNLLYWSNRIQRELKILFSFLCITFRKYFSVCSKMYIVTKGQVKILRTNCPALFSGTITEKRVWKLAQSLLTKR